MSPSSSQGMKSYFSVATKMSTVLSLLQTESVHWKAECKRLASESSIVWNFHPIIPKNLMFSPFFRCFLVLFQFHHFPADFYDLIGIFEDHFASIDHFFVHNNMEARM